MLYLRVILLGAISGLFPFLPMIALYHYIVLKKEPNRKVLIPHIAAVYLFCFALIAILSVTDIPDAYHLTLIPSINVIPFVDIFKNTLQYGLNILLFVPVGFLLPILWKPFMKKRVTLLFGFLLSLSIETIQLFNYRITDIDDLLMNTLGATIGCFAFVLTKRIFPKISVLAVDPINLWKWEPHVCVGFAWLSMLFCQPIVFRWLIPRLR